MMDPPGRGDGSNRWLHLFQGPREGERSNMFGMPTADAAGANSLLPGIKALTAADDVSHAEVQLLIELHADRQQVPLAEWYEVVSLLSDRCGRWQSRWLFSPAAHPDRTAAAELQGWRALYATCAEALLTRAPEVRARLERQHDVKALRHVLQRRVEGTDGRPGRRIVLGLLSQTAGLLSRAGLSGVATRLDSVALYPKGSVGRALGSRPSSPA